MQRLTCALTLSSLLLLSACGEAPDTIRARQYGHTAAPGTVEAAPLPPGPNAGNMTQADMAPVPLAPLPAATPMTDTAPLPPVTDVTATTQKTTVTTQTDMPAAAPGTVVKTESVKTVAKTTLVPAAPKARVQIADLKFGLTQPDYAPILKAAIADALTKNPNASFDVVVVTPAGGSDKQTDVEAERAAFNGNTVMHTIMDYDVPVERINLSAATDGAASGTEVRVYSR